MHLSWIYFIPVLGVLMLFIYLSSMLSLFLCWWCCCCILLKTFKTIECLYQYYFFCYCVVVIILLLLLLLYWCYCCSCCLLVPPAFLHTWWGIAHNHFTNWDSWNIHECWGWKLGKKGEGCSLRDSSVGPAQPAGPAEVWEWWIPCSWLKGSQLLQHT